MTRAFGHVAEPLPATVSSPEHGTFGDLIGAVAKSSLPDLDEPSQVHLRGEVQDQYNGEACVAFSLAKCAWRCAVLHGDTNAELPSALHIWTIGRRRFSGPDEPLVNRGTYPRLVRDAVRQSGLVADRHYPYVEADFNKDIPPRIHRLAYDQAGLDSYSIDEFGQRRIEAIKATLRSRSTVQMALKVDGGFCDFTGDEILMSVNMADIKGGHMVNIIAVEPDDTIVIENSWGRAWGITHGELVGCARLSPDLVAYSEAVLEILAIRSVPAVLP